MAKQYYTAIIKSTSLGFESHGIFTTMLHLEWHGGGISFGGYALDEFLEEENARFGSGVGLDFVREIMETVGVENWEDLPGKYLVVETEGWGTGASGIRNILDESKWLRPEEWFKSRGRK